MSLASSMNNGVLFQITNKRIPLGNRHPAFPIIGVGGYSADARDGRPLIYSDSSGISSISNQNDIFSELTAHYWVWKNYDLSDVSFVGFFHHRRYFNFHKPIAGAHKVLYPGIENCINSFCVEVQLKEASKILDYCDYISIRAEYNDPLDIRWPSHHSPEVWRLLKVILNQPEYSLYNSESFFSLHRRLVWYPMFVARKDVFLRICKDLFDILFVVRDNVESDRDRFGVGQDNPRYLAYLSEPLLMLLVHSYRLRTYEAQVVVSEPDSRPSILV